MDHIIVLGEVHLRRVLQSYADYYNSVRTRRSLNKDAPVSRPVQRTGVIRSRAILGGLHHRYARVYVFGTHSSAARAMQISERSSPSDRRVPTWKGPVSSRTRPRHPARWQAPDLRHCLARRDGRRARARVTGDSVGCLPSSSTKGWLASIGDADRSCGMPGRVLDQTTQNLRKLGPVCTENLNTGVAVMKSAQDGA